MPVAAYQYIVVRAASTGADTHEVLQSTALELFLQRGYDGVTAAQISEAAGVTERTFFRHFPSKDEILLGGHEERLALLDRVLSDRPGDEPVLESLRAAVGEVVTDFGDATADLRARMEIISRTPSLAWRSAKMQSDWEQVLAEFVRSRLDGSDAALKARLIAACAVAAIRVSLEAWLERGGMTDIDLRELCDEALLLAADGSNLGWA